ncbi:MAG TPA: TlpA disulfide reductase family protein [Chitinophagaceae bacterium]|nr:TlpA disulfide reductase family protein [Chitinophagaceae bacterium]
MLRLFICCCFLFCISLADAQEYFKPGQFVIKGQVKNFKEPFFEFGMTSYLNNESHSVPVQADGRFEQSFPVQYQQDIYFYLNDDAISFTVKDKDTLLLEWDNDHFTPSFSIRAGGENRNLELALQWISYRHFRDPFMKLFEMDKKTSAEEKYKKVNDLFNRHIELISDSFQRLHAQIPGSQKDREINFTRFANQLFASVLFQYNNFLWQNRMVPQFKVKPAKDSSGYFSGLDIQFLKYQYGMLNEFWFRDIPEYRDFLFNYVRFQKPFNSWHAIPPAKARDFNPTYDDYHTALGAIQIGSIRDWFIMQSIIFGFGHYDFTDVEKIYGEALPVITDPWMKETLQNHYTAIKQLKPGNPAPAFTLKNEKGQMVSLSDFKGKVVYIDFWGVFCGPCIYDIKNHIPQLHDYYKDKEVVFINICVDAKEKQWKDALEKYKLDGINLIAEGWTDHPVCQAYNISSIPHYILIDKEGTIVNNNARRPSGIDLKSGKNVIDNLLKPQGAK